MGWVMVRLRECVYRRLVELKREWGEPSINATVEKLLQVQTTEHTEQQVKPTGESQVKGHYTITVNEDTYNALSILKAYLSVITGQELTMEDVIGVLITYWTLKPRQNTTPSPRGGVLLPYVGWWFLKWCHSPCRISLGSF
jgi:predicted CopG family antitoxin